MNCQENTIAAICTPHGRAGLSVIRVSGVAAIEVVSKISRLFSGKKITDLDGFCGAAGEVIFNSEVIDQVVFLVFKSPRSFTGENVVEISCHGNPLICQKILNALFFHGARQAGPGEFTQQAFANGKLDLIQAQAIHELVMANNSVVLQKSLDKLRQGLSSEIKAILKQTFSLIAILEASFEFSEEEHQDFQNLATKELEELELSCHKVKQSLENNLAQNTDVKLVIIGIPNAGKSTLFNCLIGFDRAIVSNLAGTTRDFIESNLCHQGEVWKLVDTAGIRQTSDKIEQIGITKAQEQAQSADLTIFVFDSTVSSEEQNELLETFASSFEQKTVFVASKMDICTNPQLDQSISWVKVNYNDQGSINLLKQSLVEKISQLKSKDSSTFLLSELQKNLCQRYFQQLDQFKEGFQQGTGFELLAPILSQGTKILGNLTSKDSNTEVYNQVFSKFCIGK